MNSSSYWQMLHDIPRNHMLYTPLVFEAGSHNVVSKWFCYFKEVFYGTLLYCYRSAEQYRWNLALFEKGSWKMQHCVSKWKTLFMVLTNVGSVEIKHHQLGHRSFWLRPFYYQSWYYIREYFLLTVEVAHSFFCAFSLAWRECSVHCWKFKMVVTGNYY